MCGKDLVESGKCRSEALEEGGNLWVGPGRALTATHRALRLWRQKQVAWEKFTPPPYALLPTTCSLFWALSWDPSLLAPHPSRLGLLPALRSPQPLPCQCPPAAGSWEGLWGHVLYPENTHVLSSPQMQFEVFPLSDQIVHVVLYPHAIAFWDTFVALTGLSPLGGSR